MPQTISERFDEMAEEIIFSWSPASKRDYEAMRKEFPRDVVKSFLLTEIRAILDSCVKEIEDKRWIKVSQGEDYGDIWIEKETRALRTNSEMDADKHNSALSTAQDIIIKARNNVK